MNHLKSNWGIILILILVCIIAWLETPSVIELLKTRWHIAGATLGITGLIYWFES